MASTQINKSQVGRRRSPDASSPETMPSSGRDRPGDRDQGRDVPVPWSTRGLLGMSPFDMMRRFTDQMDRAFSGLGLPHGQGEETWSPALEIFEQGDQIVVRAELPGMDADDIRVEDVPGGIVLQGERRREFETREEGLYRSERSYGHFYRFVPLPETAQPEQAEAQFRNGVLEVVVPIEATRERRRRIPVESGGTARDPRGSGRDVATRSSTDLGDRG